MLFDKKGDVQFDWIINVVLIIAGAIIVILVLIVIFGENENIDNLVCKSTLYISDQSKGFIGPLCKTQYKKLEDEEKLAETILTTWEVFGKGDLNPSGTKWFKWPEQKCFRYYRGEITKKSKLIGVSGSEFIRYLRDEKNREPTYWNHINRKAEDESRVIVAFNELEEGDFLGVYYFENVEPSFFSPFTMGYRLGYEFGELIHGEAQDRILIAKDNPLQQFKCVEIV